MKELNNEEYILLKSLIRQRRTLKNNGVNKTLLDFVWNQKVYGN